MEADLQRHYGIELVDLFRGRLSWRRLGVLVEHLPDTNATRRSLGDDAADWGLTEHLLAAAVDCLRAANWQRSGKGRQPKPIPRPGVQSEPRPVARHGHVDPDRSPAEVAAFFRQFAPPPIEEVVNDGN